jgi:catechol 2,3-dioxygenase-like lactoylglutathione lyase family enzyme
MNSYRIAGLDHIQLAMPAGRENDARAFYSAILGLPAKPKPEHLAKRGGVWFETELVKLHLGVDSDFRPARKAHPGLLVQGLENLLERLRSEGYSVTADEPLPGYQRAYVDDPFGNRLELLERDG